MARNPENLVPLRPDPSQGPSPWTLLLAATQELSAQEDLKAALGRVVERVRDALGADSAAVLLLDDRERELRFEAAVGVPESVVEHWRFGPGQGIVGTVVATGEAVRVDDVGEDARYLDACPGTRSEAAVPLRVKGRTLGVLDVGSRRGAAFDAADVEALRLASDCVAAAIDGRRLYDNVKEQARILSVIHEVSRELTSVLDRRRVLERVADRLRGLLDYDVFTVYLWSDVDQRLHPWLWKVTDRVEHHSQLLQLGEGITGTAAALRQLIRVPNVSVDPRYVACDHGLGIRSEMAVPLVFEDRLIGVLDLECIEPDAFRPEHEQLLSTLASSLAIALANAEVHEQLREREQRLHEDLDAARKVQRQLLPRATPWVKCLQIAVANEPARHLGGDFYDFLHYGEGRVGIAVGDVAGKATSAALYGSLAVGILRELSRHRHPAPAEMLALMNQKLLELEVERRFVAMTFAVFDSETRRLVLANSGLPYPYLIRGGSVEEIELGGVPLGLIEHPGYREVELELRGGEALVIASDGLCEALDAEERELGGETLMAAVSELADRPTRELADGLLETARRHAGRAEASDDRTVVVLRGCDAC